MMWGKSCADVVGTSSSDPCRSLYELPNMISYLNSAGNCLIASSYATAARYDDLTLFIPGLNDALFAAKRSLAAAIPV